jgi:hypothetical protein
VVICLVLILVSFLRGVVISYGTGCNVSYYLFYPVWFFVFRVVCFPVLTSNSIKCQIATSPVFVWRLLVKTQTHLVTISTPPLVPTQPPLWSKYNGRSLKLTIHLQPAPRLLPFHLHGLVVTHRKNFVRHCMLFGSQSCMLLCLYLTTWFKGCWCNITSELFLLQ